MTNKLAYSIVIDKCVTAICDNGNITLFIPDSKEGRYKNQITISFEELRLLYISCIEARQH